MNPGSHSLPGFVLMLLALVIAPRLDAQQSVASQPQFQFPLDGSRWVSPATPLIIRPGAELDPTIAASGALVRVTGSASGAHAGRIALADDHRTLIFTPLRAFAADETVSVSVGEGLRDSRGAAIAAWSFAFHTSLAAQPAIDPRVVNQLAPNLDAAHAAPVAQGTPADSAQAKEDPSDGLPRVVVSVSDNPTPGLIYLSNMVFNTSIDNSNYLLMLDNAGVPHYAKKVDAQALDFKEQPNGTITYGSRNGSIFYVLDNEFNLIDSVKLKGGYEADLHDIEMLPDGHVLLLGADPQVVDMSTVVTGGKRRASVLAMLIQELDSARNVVFQWRTLDHFHISDATHEDLAAFTIDYVHCNSIQIDTDGNILLSSRNLDEITKINRATGDIMWRLGGKNNQFTFVNDSIGFSHQHAARRIANGHITLFDNGNFHTPAYSRAAEYALDESAKTATLVWQFRHTPDVWSNAMGYVQRLDNGNTMIGWGASDIAATEVRPDGTTALEMLFKPGLYSYRAFRFPGASSNAVALISPANGAPGISAEPELHWNPAPGATTYSVELSPDSTFRSDVLTADLSDVTKQFTIASSMKHYYWHVRPHFGSRDGNWSATWQFTIGPTALVPIAPVNGAQRVALNPRFEWTRIPEAFAYHIQIARDSAFTDLALEDSLTLPSGVVGPLGSGVTYFWRVRWETDSIAGLWSDAWRFTTSGPLSAPPNDARTAGGAWLRAEAGGRGDGITIRCFMPTRGHATIALFDECGALQATLLDGDVEAGDRSIDLDTRALAAGHYFCRLMTGSGMVVEKIVVER